VTHTKKYKDLKMKTEVKVVISTVLLIAKTFGTQNKNGPVQPISEEKGRKLKSQKNEKNQIYNMNI
jgi:hypothetical protein